MYVSRLIQADGKWYPARIASVAGAADNAVYNIIYTKTRTTEMLPGADLRIRKIDPNAPAPTKSAKAQAQRMMTNDERARERERNRARKEKKMKREAEKNKVQADKQATWQKFAAKSAKKSMPGAKGLALGPSTGPATAGTPRMTPNAQRTKHVYEEADE